MKSKTRELPGFILKILRLKFSGFTLIELIIVIGIVTLVSTGGLFMYRDYSRKQTVAQAGELIKTVLSSTRQRALSGERPAGCSGELRGYSFTCSGSPVVNQYAVTAQCVSGVVVSFGELPGGVSFGVCPTVEFFVLGAGTDLSPSGLNAQIIGWSNSFPLFIQQSGIIQ